MEDFIIIILALIIAFCIYKIIKLEKISDNYLISNAKIKKMGYNKYCWVALICCILLIIIFGIIFWIELNI